jgi:hypothetical protein
MLLRAELAALQCGLIRALAPMKKIIATLGIALICASVVVGADHAAVYDWRPSLTVEADLDRNGQMDSARLGIAAESIRLLVTVNSKPMPVIDIPVDGSKQFGICPGSVPGISVLTQSNAPLNVLGELPQGYEICPDCIEIVITGGECDSLHFYWDTTTNQLAWWRA